MIYQEDFKGYYDGVFAAIEAICRPQLGDRQAKISNEVVVTGIGCELFFPAFHYKGLIPVLVDVNLDSFLPGLDVIENCIVEGKTKAVLFPFPMGNTVNMEQLRDICDEYNVFLIEFTLGETVSGLGDLSVFRNKDGLTVQVRSNPILANSIGFSKQTLETKQGNRKVSRDYLLSELLPHKQYFRFQQTVSIPDWYGFAITVKETSPFDRTELAQHLKENGIYTKLIESATLLLQPSYKNIKHVVFQDLVNSDVIMRDTLYIPLRQNKKEEYIVKTIKEFVESRT